MHMLLEGHIALAITLRDESFYLAWGTIPEGDPVWANNPPAMDMATQALIKEVGRRKVTLASYCIEDPAGTIEANGKLWKLSQSPTRHLYLQFKFSSTDNPDNTVYQMALYTGTVPNKDLTPVTCQVSNTGGYAAGTSQIKVSGFSQGVIQDLLPHTPLSKMGGRKIQIADQVLRVKAIDVDQSILTITPLTKPVLNGAPITSAATTAVPNGKFYITPGELLDPGTIFLGENRPPIFRNQSIRESFEIILTL